MTLFYFWNLSWIHLHGVLFLLHPMCTCLLFMWCAAQLRDIMCATGLTLDPCYTLKGVRGMLSEMQTNPARFQGNKVLYIHTGMHWMLVPQHITKPFIETVFFCFTKVSTGPRSLLISLPSPPLPPKIIYLANSFNHSSAVFFSGENLKCVTHYMEPIWWGVD